MQDNFIQDEARLSFSFTQIHYCIFLQGAPSGVWNISYDGWNEPNDEEKGKFSEASFTIWRHAENHNGLYSPRVKTIFSFAGGLCLFVCLFVSFGQ